MGGIINCHFLRVAGPGFPLFCFALSFPVALAAAELSSLSPPSRGLQLSVCPVRVCNHGVSLVAAVVRSVENNRCGGNDRR